MRRLILVVIAALLAVAAGGTPGERLATAKLPPPDSAALALVDDRPSGMRLAWLAPRTLERLPLGSVPLRGGAWAPVSSPDGSRVALGGLGNEGVRFVDLERMSLVGRVGRWSVGKSITPVAWPDARRVLALEFERMQGPGVPRVQQLLAVDPLARRVVARRSLRGWAIATAVAGRETVMLVEPAAGIGAARLVLADRNGRLRAVVLRRMLAGSRQLRRGQQMPSFRIQNPGLAVDPRSRTAFVFGAGSLVAEVDLARLAVSYHTLSQRTSFFSRVLAWLEPVAQAKIISGWSRQAAWLGEGLIAVSGSNSVANRTTPIGLQLVDTRAWRVRTLEPGATHFLLAGELLLAAGSEYHGGTGSELGIGIAAYTRAGEKLWQVLDGEPVGWLQATGGFAYAPGRDRTPRTVRVVELASGAVLREVVGELPTFFARDGS